MKLELLSIRRLKFPSKKGQIMKDSRRFSVWCCVVKPPFCIESASSSRTHLMFLILLRRSQRLWTQTKVNRPSFSLNLHPSTKMIVLVIPNVNICIFFHSKRCFFFVKSKEGEVSVVHIVMNQWKLSFWWMDANSLRKMA